MSDSTDHQRNLPVPFFSQRQVTYQWQRLARGIRTENNILGEKIETQDADSIYGQSAGFYAHNTAIGDKVNLSAAVCNVLSMCMLLHYYGITDDSPDEMLYKIFTTKFRGGGTGTGAFLPYDFRYQRRGWAVLQSYYNLKQIPHLLYNVPTSYIRHFDGTPPQSPNPLRLDGVKEQIKKGNPVMISYGPINDGTQNPILYRGHIAVIRGFTSSGKVILNDPWGDVGTAAGSLRSDNFGRFFTATSWWADQPVYSNLGIGDNTVITEENMHRFMVNPRSRNPHFFNALYIEYPHIWSFPFKQGATAANRGTTFRFSEPPRPLQAGEAAPNPQQITTQRRIDRENRVNAMLRFEDFAHAGFPVNLQRLWHDGIHLNGNGPVYAIGPGRIVAARIKAGPSVNSSSFVLVRHRVWLNNTKKEFYSHYMHLAPEDIAARYRNNLQGDPDNPAMSWQRDWLDEIIERVMPMRAIWWQRESNTVFPGMRIRTYRADGTAYKENEGEDNDDDNNNYDTNITRQSLFYLRPKANTGNHARCVRTAIETISPDDNLEQDMRWLHSALTSVNTYTHSITNNNETHNYYEIYYKTENRNAAGDSLHTHLWTTRFIRTTNVVLQPINIPEFIYYRRILADLLKGKVVEFTKEPLIRDRHAGTEDPIRLLHSTLRAVFPEEGVFVTQFEPATFRSAGNDGYKALYNAMYPDIQRFYINKINAVAPAASNSNRAAEIENIIGELVARIFLLGKRLIEIPEAMLISPAKKFNSGEQWHIRLAGEDKQGSVSVLRSVIRHAFPPQGQDHGVADGHWAEHRKAIFDYFGYLGTLNIDYFIEVNGNTKLGMPGRYQDNPNLIHFEIFSGVPKNDNAKFIAQGDLAGANGWNNNWTEHVPEHRKFVEVAPINQKNDFFKVSEIFSRLRDKNLHSLITPSFEGNGLSAFIRNFAIQIIQSLLVPPQYTIVQHMHSHVKLPASEWREIISNSDGMNNNLSDELMLNIYMAYKWFTKELAEELEKHTNYEFVKNSTVMSIFYHPIRFLAYLDEAPITETANRR